MTAHRPTDRLPKGRALRLHLESEERVLWAEFVRNGNMKAREALSLRYIPLVRHVLNKMSISLPRHMELDDLMGAGVLGLMEAIDGFDPECGIQFTTYAVHRIRGAILDELRTMDVMSRSARKWARQLEIALSRLEQELGRPASEAEIAEELGMDVEQYREILSKVSPIALFSLNSPILQTDGGEMKADDAMYGLQDVEIQAQIEREDLRRLLAASIDRLPDQHKLVVALYYYEDLTLSQIGQVMNVSESRSSQIYTEAIIRLRTGIKESLASMQELKVGSVSV